MAITMGAISLVSQTSDYTSATVSLVCGAATAGTGPYTYQWYRSTDPAFSPGGGNILAGKTSLSLTDTGLIPGTQYYYICRGTDTGHSNDVDDSATYSYLSLAPTLDPNQFEETTLLGVLDQSYNPNTHSVQLDPSYEGTVKFGQAVKLVDTANGAAPAVTPCDDDEDECFGFVNFNIKNLEFSPGDMLEVSLAGNVMWLFSTTAIARGAQVCLDVITRGGVKAATGSSDANIVGFAYDKATAAGQLIRVYIKSPSFAFDAA